MRRIVLLLLILVPTFSIAQSLPAIEEKTKGLKKFEGYFNFYWDENAGKTGWRLIKWIRKYYTKHHCLLQ
jgi:hypothetical protein